MMSSLFKRERINTRKIFLILIYTLAFLYGLNFLGYSNIILTILILLLLARQFFCNKIRIQKGVFIVGGFTFFFFLFYAINYSVSISDVFYYLLFPISLYLIGGSIGTKNKSIDEKNESLIFNFLFSISLGFVFRAFLGMILTSLNYGLFQTSRLFLDIWGYGKTFVAATGVNPYIVLMSAISFPLMFIKSDYKRWWHVLIGALGLIFSLYVSFVLQNRTGVVVIAIEFFFFFFFLTLIDFKKNKKLILTIVVLFTFLILAFVIAYNSSLKFKEMVNSIPVLNRLLNFNEDSYSERRELYSIFFDRFIYYPFGGMTANGGIVNNEGIVISGYFHNTVLDVYKISGVIPTVFFIMLILMMVKNQLDYFVYSKDAFFKLFIGEIIVAILGMFFLEPMFEANIYFFLLVFLIYGSVERLAYNYKLFIVRTKEYQNINREKFKIVMVSNFLSIHQMKMHEALVKLYGNRYHFISLEEALAEHKVYNPHFNEEKSNEIMSFKSEDEMKKALKLIDEADVVIYGNANEKILKHIRKKGKIIIQCSERPYKTSKYARWKLRSILGEIRHIMPYEDKYQTFCLTLSAYAAYDYEKVNHVVNKCFSWAYWVNDNEFKSFDEVLQKKSSDKIKIVFVNRLIEWKHPEKIVLLGEYLKKQGVNFSINIIGTGTLKNDLEKMVSKKGLTEDIHFLGVMDNESVRRKIEESHILLSTSDQNEGWGATVNEGMISGCAVVASHTTGAAYTLIENGKNGFVYDFSNDNDLFEKVLLLCNNKDLREQIGKNAFSTMKNEYNADSAIKKLDSFIVGLTEGKIVSQNKGILSPSPLISPEEVCQKIKSTNEETKDIVQKTPKPMGLKKGALISYLAIALNIIAGLLYTPWLIKELGQSNYGIYSLATSIVSLFAIDLGLGTAVSRFIAKYRAEKDVKASNKMLGIIFKCFIVLGCILFVALSIVYIFLPKIYLKLTPDEISSLRIVFIMVGLLSIVSFTFTPLNGILIGNDNFPEYKMITLICRIVNIILVVLTLLIHSDLYLFVMIIVFTGLLELIIKWIVIKKKCEYGSKPILNYNDRSMFQTLIKFSFWAAICSLASRYIISINPTILGIFSGSAQISIFTLGSTIEGYVWQFANGLDGMFIPRLSEMNNRNATPNEYTNLMIKIGRIQLLFTGLIIIGFISLGRGFINDIWKLKDSTTMESYDHSYFVAVLLLLPCLVTFTQQIGNSSLIVKNKIKYRGIAMIITAALTVSFSFLLTYLFPNYGAIFAAVAVFLGKTVGMVIVLNYFYKKVLGINLKKFFKNVHLKILPLLVLTLIFGICIDFLISNSSLVNFGIKVILVTCFYMFITYKFTMNKEEKRLLLTSVEKIEKVFISTL